ncbi:MAG TPA: HAMP domain-containing sensor histidine kinase [Chloroflexota bacterium]|nr:HAMP domain-containing sensor histidine kinase [Chloroflexota bacterium]
MLIVGSILLLLGASIYFAVSSTLMDQVDRHLMDASGQAMPALFGPSHGRGNPDETIGGRGGYRGGIFYLHFDASGQVVANPQQVTTTDISWPIPSTATPTFATITVNGDPVRALGLRAPDGDILIVGQNLQPEQTALQILLLILLGGGGLGLLLSLGGAWFLAGRALRPIQRAFQRQQEFVADASHELRTPLTVLRSATDLLNRTRSTPLEENAELFDDVRSEIARMQHLTEDLLTLARSDRGELELMTAPLQLADLARDVVRRTLLLAEAKSVELSCSAAATPIVEADPDRLQQVLVVLIDNAIKHTPRGGTVNLRVSQHGANALLDIADSGTGISAEHLPRIFDRFYRADGARSEGGTGLGLAIAKMLVEAHGGSLAVRSVLGSGTQVTVALPSIPTALPRFLSGHSKVHAPESRQHRPLTATKRG